MKVVLKRILIIAVVLILFMGAGMIYLSMGLESGKNVAINEINLATLEDGVYNGSYDSGRWANEVAVTVSSHKITKIEVVKDVKFKKPEVTEEILNRIIEKQSTKVDSVSGATVNSKAYLKSVENALDKK